MLSSYQACNYDFSTSNYGSGLIATPVNSYYNNSVQVKVVEGVTTVRVGVNNVLMDRVAVKQIQGYFDTLNDDGLGSNSGTHMLLRDVVAMSNYLTDQQLEYINQFSNL